mmetsp:Transcript_17379/g.61137  ORF Transcript_17379/g.61137 Transcript_17379/m.61137 type:complete len:207 (-) Transcript_17379:692-1312(-)
MSKGAANASIALLRPRNSVVARSLLSDGVSPTACSLTVAVTTSMRLSRASSWRVASSNSARAFSRYNFAAACSSSHLPLGDTGPRRVFRCAQHAGSAAADCTPPATATHATASRSIGLATQAVMYASRTCTYASTVLTNVGLLRAHSSKPSNPDAFLSASSSASLTATESKNRNTKSLPTRPDASRLADWPYRCGAPLPGGANQKP